MGAKTEAKESLVRHLAIIADLRLHAITNNPGKNEFLYLMSVPMIYAAWEGYFRIAMSICLRRACVRGRKHKKYKEKYVTLWLQKQGFVNSFFDRLFNTVSLGKIPKKINSGRFNALSDLTCEFKIWLEAPIDHLQNFDELVMTYANVNKDVVIFNSEIIGLDITQVNLGRLDDLLARRNDIAHGGLIDYPKENIINDLLTYTENLLNQFHTSIESWLEKN